MEGVRDAPYVTLLLALAGLSNRVDLVLQVFGVASLTGIWNIGLLIDRMLRSRVLLSLAEFALSALALGVAGTQPPVAYRSIMV
ncbi:hypothetical protein [Pseudomonas aeruginosa]|uniref:hypothetical protein n=1 Tax=Pseudomonas aeruginosa TaxID=287 RepID=UPI00093ACFAE|nr:hypothetical protein [Pseudomonas aeruginosa]HBO1345089.1 hypothetical protein [Pseudomonas aeruginosa]